MKIWQILVAIGVLSVLLVSPTLAQMGHKMGPPSSPEQEKIVAHWEGMEKLSQELKTHTKSMKGITDQAKLLAEVLKHQEMIDTFIGKMIEMQHMRRDMMQEFHKKMMEKQKKEPGGTKGK